MESRMLGTTGLAVSAISFGAMTFGEGGQASLGPSQIDEARRIVDICLDFGVNLFDTADVYSDGTSETLLGQALGKRRSGILIATKVHGRTGADRNDVGLSRHHIIRSCDASLRRLGTDWIDLYLVHGFDAFTRLEDTLRALDHLVHTGKVRYIGCSNYSGWHLLKALSTSDRLSSERFAAYQGYYSLVGRDAENEIIPACLDQGLGFLVWSPLASGFLSGKYSRTDPLPAGSRRARFNDPGDIPQEHGFAVLDAVQTIAGQRGVTPSQVALNWLLQKRGVTSLVVGSRSEAQVTDALTAASWSLSQDELRLLDDTSAQPRGYPYWHQQRHNTERMPAAD